MCEKKRAIEKRFKLFVVTGLKNIQFVNCLIYKKIYEISILKVMLVVLFYLFKYFLSCDFTHSDSGRDLHWTKLYVQGKQLKQLKQFKLAPNHQ